MKTLDFTWVYLIGALLWATIPAPARDAAGDNSLRVDRLSTIGSGEFDIGSVQRVAQLMGYGRFYVSAVKLGVADAFPSDVRVIYVFSSIETARNHEPVKRIFYGGPAANTEVNIGNDAELLSFFLRSRLSKIWEEKTVAQVIPAMLTAAVYENRATLLCAQRSTLSAEERKKNAAPAAREFGELKALGRDPSIRRDSDGRLIWTGRIARDDGVVEEVTVTLSPSQDNVVEVKRVAVASLNVFRDTAVDKMNIEEWVISSDPTWYPSKRYGLMLTLATLGNAKAKYQLGLVLLAEHDTNSNAEGMKWLRAAAADGYGDAALRLDQINADCRPARDREVVRPVVCCRPRVN
jgi:hypothetical protein